MGDLIYQVTGFIGGVVEDLDLVKVGRVVEGGDGAHGALGDVELVVEGELGGYFGEVMGVAGGVCGVPCVGGSVLFGFGFPDAAGEEKEHYVAVEAVEEEAEAGEQVDGEGGAGEHGGVVYLAFLCSARRTSEAGRVSRMGCKLESRRPKERTSVGQLWTHAEQRTHWGSSMGVPLLAKAMTSMP